MRWTKDGTQGRIGNHHLTDIATQGKQVDQSKTSNRRRMSTAPYRQGSDENEVRRKHIPSTTPLPPERGRAGDATATSALRRKVAERHRISPVNATALVLRETVKLRCPLRAVQAQSVLIQDSTEGRSCHPPCCTLLDEPLRAAHNRILHKTGKSNLERNLCSKQPLFCGQAMRVLSVRPHVKGP